MKRLKSLQIMLLAVLLLILAACSNGARQPASEEPRPSASQTSDQGLRNRAHARLPTLREKL